MEVVRETDKFSKKPLCLFEGGLIVDNEATLGIVKKPHLLYQNCKRALFVVAKVIDIKIDRTIF